MAVRGVGNYIGIMITAAVLLGGCAAQATNLVETGQAKLMIKDNPKTQIYGVTLNQDESAVELSGNVSLRNPGALKRFSVAGHVDVKVVDDKGEISYISNARVFPNLDWGKLSRPLYYSKRFILNIPNDKVTFAKGYKVILYFHEGQHD